MSLSLRLRQDRHALVQEMRTVCDSKNPSDAARWKELDVKQEALRAQIQDAETNNLETEMSTVRNADRPNVDTRDSATLFGNGTPALTRSQEIRSTAAYRKQFGAWVAGGDKSPEMRDLETINSTGGQTLVPVGFQREIDKRLKSFAGIRQAARIVTTPKGAPLTWPTADDTLNTGQFLPETNATSEQDPTFGSVTFGSNLVSSKLVKISVQLAQDSFESVEMILADMLSKRIGRVTEPTYLTGNGSGQPNGLLTALIAAGYTGGPSGSSQVLALGANANSGNSADNEVNSIGTGDIDALYSALDPEYAANASYMANSTTWQKLRGQLDKYGRPIWSVSLSSGAPDQIWGRPIFNNQQMAGIGAGNISMLCGDFNHYVIRDVLGLTMVRFNELYMSTYEIGYQMFIRTDGQLLQSAAFTYLQHRAS
jgi:HK97 family phage major capsid protein